MTLFASKISIMGSSNSLLKSLFPSVPSLNLLILLILLLLSSNCIADEMRNAIKNGDTQKVISIIRSGYSVDQPDEFGATPISNAAFFGRKYLASYLLRKKADCSLGDKAGTLPVHYASGFKKSDILLMLLDKNCPYDEPTVMGFTPLMYAAAAGQAENVAILLRHGSDPNKKSKENRLPMEYALQARSPETIRAFANSKTIINEEERIIDYALKKVGNPECIRATRETLQKVQSATRTLVTTARDLHLSSRPNNTNNNSEISKYDSNALEHNYRTVKNKINTIEENQNSYSILLGRFTNTTEAKRYWEKSSRKVPSIRAADRRIIKNGKYFELLIGSSSVIEETQLFVQNLNRYEINAKIIKGSFGMEDSIKKSLSSMQETATRSLNEKLSQPSDVYTKKTKNNLPVAIKNLSINKEKIEDNLEEDCWIFNFGLFLNEDHAYRYWMDLNNMYWMDVLSLNFEKKIVDKVDSGMVEMTAGALLSTTDVWNLVDLMKGLGIRVSANAVKIKDLPKNMSAMTYKEFNHATEVRYHLLKNRTSSKPTYDDEKTDTTYSVRVGEAVPVNIKSLNINHAKPKSAVSLRVTYYLGMGSAKKDLLDFADKFEVLNYRTIRTMPRAYALYITVAETSADAGCGFFASRGMSCISLSD